MTGTGRRSPVRRALLAAIGFYSRAISPALPARCRFYPTCSAYAAEAVAVHGAGRGTWLALKRLAKCAPWHPGGVDLVPGSPAARRTAVASPVLPDRRGTPVTGHPTTDRATPPASRRAPLEESSVV